MIFSCKIDIFVAVLAHFMQHSTAWTHALNSLLNFIYWLVISLENETDSGMLSKINILHCIGYVLQKWFIIPWHYTHIMLLKILLWHCQKSIDHAKSLALHITWNIKINGENIYIYVTICHYSNESGKKQTGWR